MKNKYITTHEELLKLHGRKVSCKIDGEFIDDAMVHVDSDTEGYISICQNKGNNSFTGGRLGYKYSWWVSNIYKKYECSNTQVTEIQLIDEEIQTLPNGIKLKITPFWEGDLPIGEETPKISCPEDFKVKELIASVLLETGKSCQIIFKDRFVIINDDNFKQVLKFLENKKEILRRKRNYVVYYQEYNRLSDEKIAEIYKILTTKEA